MAKPPVSGHNNPTSEHLQSIGLQTWILRVYIHCEGCKKKVFKVLQSIDGVYKTVIDAKEHKVTVTGSVNGEILVQKLLKSGKHAEILPESFAAKAAADNASGHSNSKKKKKQSNKQLQNDVVATATDDDVEHVNDEQNESKGASSGGNVEKIADPAVTGGDGGGNGNETGGGKKKKNKKKKVGDTHVQPNIETDGLPAETATASMEQLNLGPQMPQLVYSTPYDIPPYQSYYPTPAYGVSYSTSYPSAESSYYTPPVYGYAQSHPSVFYPPPPPPPSNYRRSAFDDYDDEGGEGRACAIM
ncbi:putative heavy metal-associated domain, HMA, heavy metal-associated domain superfamily [Helianthus annuus]|nr:putative heavy metal-associated domain, HMA, heavy metal-associated domain superfamily [Helianthus annuus]